MVKNNVTNTENIHVKVDQNNLIYIDPNSSIDGEGNISPRNVQVEKLVMFVSPFNWHFNSWYNSK